MLENKKASKDKSLNQGWFNIRLSFTALAQHHTSIGSMSRYVGYSPKAEMTLPSVTSDLLMLPPSFNLSPLVPAESALSLIKNTKHQPVNT